MKILFLVRDAAIHWSRNQAARRSAALTYYALASMASLLILLLSAAGLFFNPERVSRFLVSPVATAIGEDNSQFIQDLVQNYYNPEASFTAGALSVLIILNTGSNLFIQLDFSLNRFLKIDVSPPDIPPVRQILHTIVERLKAFAYVLGAEVMILAGLFATVGLQFADERIGNLIDLPFNAYQWSSRLLRVSLAVAMLALIYRYLPKKRMSWRAVWSGAAIAGLLFTLLQGLMSYYLGSAGIGSAFGAAGSLVVFLYWVYYSIQTLFFGAAWAKVLDDEKK
jgi:membrane protein